MLFPTVQFAIFFTVVLALNWLVRRWAGPWRVMMIAASFFFYGYWDARFIPLLAGYVIVNYAVARAISAERDRTSAAESSDSQPAAVAVASGVDGTPSSAEASGLPAAAASAMPGTSAPQQPPLPLDGVYVGEPPRASGAVPRGRVRMLLVAGVAFDLAGLAWFKYYGFFATSFIEAMDSLGLRFEPSLIEVLLPIGISFFTFQAISYIVDVARGVIRPMPLLDFTVYLSFFPHLLSGPIVRASEFAPQLRHRPDDHDEGSGFITSRTIPGTDACLLILSGLVKKVLVATYLSQHIVEPVFGAPNQYGGAEILLAVYAFAVVIYADFSGYTDIASGCALLLGYRFPRNFDAPYRSLSLQEFWRRWHMSLSRWLRDYVYVPLGGSRGGRLFTARNLLITFVLSGLWHGAAWHFVVWGAILGIGIVLERTLFAAPERPHPLAAVLRWLVTFHVICLGWVFFRADSMDRAFEMLERLPQGWGSAPLVTATVLLLTAGAVIVQWVPARLVERLRNGFAALPLVPQAAAFAAAIVVIESLGPDGVPPFIYFRF